MADTAARTLGAASGNDYHQAMDVTMVVTLTFETPKITIFSKDGCNILDQKTLQPTSSTNQGLQPNLTTKIPIDDGHRTIKEQLMPKIMG